MTEYWVSQAKYYCKFCKQWMADNKPTRQLHDMGEKHKSQVEYFHKKKSDDRLHGARSEKDLKQQMEAINRAAREAVASDLTENEGIFYSTNNYQQIPPPPPPSNSGAYQQGKDSAHFSTQTPAPQSASALKLSESTDKVISENLQEDNSGIYTVGDVTYLEGQYHEDQLVTDALCELFVEAEDNWCKAKVLMRRVVGIAHTELNMKSFDISYVPSSLDAWQETGAIVEVEVKSDRLRLIKGQNDLVVEEPKIDESTGFGMWETVSVKLVNDEEEAKVLAEQEKLEREKKARASERQELFEANAHSDNAMSSFDVYNTGTYKGIAISKSEASSRKIAEELESVANGKDVGFKKRKGNSGIKLETNSKKQRNIRKKSYDDDDDNNN